MNNAPSFVIIPEERIDEAKLHALAGLMGSATGSQIDIRRQFIVSTDNAACLVALETLFGDRPEQHQLAAPKEAGHKKYKPRAKKEQPLQGLRPSAIIMDELTPPPADVVDGQVRESLIHLNPAPHHEIKSWHVIKDGQEIELITISEKNKRLAEGAFEDGTFLRHPRAGLQRITGAPGTGQGMEPAE